MVTAAMKLKDIIDKRYNKKDNKIKKIAYSLEGKL